MHQLYGKHIMTVVMVAMNDDVYGNNDNYECHNKNDDRNVLWNVGGSGASGFSRWVGMPHAGLQMYILMAENRNSGLVSWQPRSEGCCVLMVAKTFLQNQGLCRVCRMLPCPPPIACIRRCGVVEAWVGALPERLQFGLDVRFCPHSTVGLSTVMAMRSATS